MRNCLTNLENWRGGHELHSNFTESYNIKGMGIGLDFSLKIIVYRFTTENDQNIVFRFGMETQKNNVFRFETKKAIVLTCF